MRWDDWSRWQWRWRLVTDLMANELRIWICVKLVGRSGIWQRFLGHWEGGSVWYYSSAVNRGLDKRIATVRIRIRSWRSWGRVSADGDCVDEKDEEDRVKKQVLSWNYTRTLRARQPWASETGFCFCFHIVSSFETLR